MTADTCGNQGGSDPGGGRLACCGATASCGAVTPVVRPRDRFYVFREADPDARMATNRGLGCAVAAVARTGPCHRVPRESFLALGLVCSLGRDMARA